MTLEINEQNGWYKCSSCGEPLEPVFWGGNINWTGFSLKQVNSGMYFKIYGGYAEFFDTIDGDNPLEVALCHDCSVKVMEIIDPNFTQTGGHPTINPDNTPCCKWCWLIPSKDISCEEAR
jgi:DNA-directed RNA polymerase subunit RPC12/RpoP